MDNEYINWKKCTSRMKRKLVFFSEAQPNLREANFRIQQITYPDGEVVSYTSPASSGGAEMMQNIHYTYDSVSNITDVVNSAPQLSNGLGGDYENHYVYDNLYRLSSANGLWRDDNFTYHLTMGYYDNGRVRNKGLTADKLLNGTYPHVSYSRIYHYNTTSQQNTIIGIDGSEIHGFQWDATGNMTYHHHEGENSGYDRYLCWDEENRLQGVVDDTHQSFYLYDANGERTYKLTTSERAQLINGHWNYYTVMDNATLYASPYLVVTRQGYTKHYYAENDRIASKIGMGGLTDICQCLCPDMTLQSGNQGGDPMNQQPYEPADLTDCEEPEECFYDKLSLNKNHFERVMSECLESNPNVEPNTLNEALYSFRENMEEYEPDCYWYHPDHLGSSSWITYTDGSAVQHLNYLPWGEDFVDQRTTNWAARHTFSAKEKDTETGLSYFGARYYSSDLSIWLSVDPMSDKYPSFSPYVYCANNPVKLVDPNGEDWYENENGTGFWQEGNAATVERNGEIYHNIGANKTIRYGNVSVSYEQNEAVSMTEHVLNPEDFRTQMSSPTTKKEGKEGNCFTQAGRMVAQSGTTSFDGTGYNISDSKAGIDYINSQIDNGFSTRVHVDRTGDGVGDHWVAISSRTTNLRTGKVESFGFYDPGTYYKNKGIKNIFTFNNNGRLQGINYNDKLYTVISVP